MPQPTHLPLPMRVAEGTGLEAEPVAEAATANALPSAPTMVGIATKSSIIHNRCIQSSSSSSTIQHRRPHGSRISKDMRSRSSGDIRSTSSAILWPAGLGHLTNSNIGVERHTSKDIGIEEETSCIGTSREHANAVARRSTSP